VARVESKTFICTENQYDAVPHVKEGVQGKLGRWLSLKEAEKELDERLPGAMTGKNSDNLRTLLFFYYFSTAKKRF
jgi:GTP-dependent phosphoenolpyruvate carboxykinase